MTEPAQRLKSELEQLSAADRAELAQFLLHSLDSDKDEDTEAAWDEELDRRATEIRGSTPGEPAESVFAALRKKYS